MSNINYLNYFYYFFLGVFSFFLNLHVSSLGVFPIDTFIHYDNGFRIILGEHPVKDYWIVHGFIIDYLQAFFFKIFGNNWSSYIYHSSIFNSAIVLFSFYIFNLLNVNKKISFLLSICISILAYPISGTPFLDLHSTYFSLFGVYFAIIAIYRNQNHFWFLSSLFLCIGFFCKQVPAGYIIILISIINFYLLIKEKNINILLFYISGAGLFLLFLFLLLFYNEIPIHDFILQVFLFPHSIGLNRYENYSLGFKNIFLDYKFIYFPFFLVIFLNLRELSKKNYLNSKNFYIFLTFISFVLICIFHQIYTQNQVFIFFLIPLCSGFAIYYNELLNINYKKKINIIILLVCLFSTIKYHERFNIERKFHELNYTTLSNALDASKINNNFKGLEWISPYFQDPQEEIDLVRSSLAILKKEDKNKMVITPYNFFSSLLEEKLFSPSRTYDSISYPRIDSEYFSQYQSHLINIIKKNKIEKIFIFEPNSNFDLDEKLFNYISASCFEQEMINRHTLSLDIKKCEDLK